MLTTNNKRVRMFRIALLLLVFAGNLHATPQIDTLNDFESAFNVGGARITVEIRDRVLRDKKEILLDWAVYSAETVTQYYGRFPVSNVHINVQVAGGHANAVSASRSGPTAVRTRVAPSL